MWKMFYEGWQTEKKPKTQTLTTLHGYEAELMDGQKHKSRK